MTRYAGQAKEHGTVDFLLNIIPNTALEALTKGDILPVVFIAVLFGLVLSKMGDAGRPLRELIDAARTGSVA